MRTLLCLLLGLACWGPTAAPAQEVRPDSEAPAPTVGLALSGGGAKGFAHIGVLQALEARGITVDVMAGTSMGSVIGSLYSVGYAPDSIASVARNQNWELVFDDRPSRGELPLSQRIGANRPLLRVPLQNGSPQLPTGLLKGQRIMMLLTRLLLPAHAVEDFTTLPIPFAAVATDLATGEGVRFTQGYLPEVVRASTAIPSLFTPVDINGRAYVDGGVARNLPAQDARALGADVVLCSEVSQSLISPDSINSFVDVLLQSVGYRMARSTAQQKELCDLVITPEVESFTIFSFGAVDSLIARGTRAVAAHDTTSGLLRRLAEADRVARASRPPDTLGAADSLSAAPSPQPWREERTLQPDSICVSEVTVSGDSYALRPQITSTLDIPEPSCLSVAGVEERVNRLYGLGLFDRVSYRVLPSGRADSSSVLRIRTEGEQEGEIGLALRYDSPYNASILFTGTQPLGASAGGRLHAEVRLGEVLRARVQYERAFSLNPPSGLHQTLEAMQFPLDLYEGGLRAVRADVGVVSVRSDVWSTLQRDLGISGGVGLEVFRTTPSAGRVAPGSGLADDDELATATGRLLYDTFPVAAYPRVGVRGLLQSEALWRMGAERPFFQYLGVLQGRLPLTPGLSVAARAAAGYTAGDRIPLHHLYYLGGADPTGLLPTQQFPFYGSAVQEQRGRQVWMVGGGLQLQGPFDLVVMPRWNAGQVMGTWDEWGEPGAISTGMGLTVGRKTLIGPVNLTVMTTDWDGPYALRVSAGPTF